MYTKKKFSETLIQQCESNFDIIKISNWAHQVFLENCSNLEEGLQELMMKIIAMQEGEEFEYSLEELQKMLHNSLS